MAGVPPTALVVEDESLLAMEVESMLQDRGFGEVALAHSYEEAETLLREGHDLAVFDMNLDGRSARPLVDAHRAGGGLAILLTGYEASELRDLGLPVLAKPVSARAFDRALAELGFGPDA